ncbi:MAG TPA: MarC family protein [Candidatus Baltobacteraceae bacterium]|nr:MarC family protein [Candidatus Baltobacteraceae bacterium]
MNLTGTLVYTFVTLLAMVNPIEAAAAFATLVSGRDARAQSQIALRASLVGCAILLGFGYAGQALLQTLGVAMDSFRVAGGLLLLKVGFNMVFAKETDSQTADDAKIEARPDPSVFPLAIPIITGPGALTAAVTLVNHGHQSALVANAIFIGCALIVFAITYVTMRVSERMCTFMGQTGVDATGRLVGIVVAAIAVQLVVNGIFGLTHFQVR